MVSLADQNHRTLLREFHCIVRAECRASNRLRQGWPRYPSAICVSFLRAECQRTLDAATGLTAAAVREGWLPFCRSHLRFCRSTATLHSGGASALTVAGLQHVERALLNGELEIPYAA